MSALGASRKAACGVWTAAYGSKPDSKLRPLCGPLHGPNLFQNSPKIGLRSEAHSSISVQEGQPGSSVSGLDFPQNGKASTFPQVRLAGTGLWSATSGISAHWTRVLGAGLCSLFSNFRFRAGETDSLLPETGSRKAVRVIARDADTGQPRSALLSEFIWLSRRGEGRCRQCKRPNGGRPWGAAASRSGRAFQNRKAH
jgi:hypothetical protein